MSAVLTPAPVAPPLVTESLTRKRFTREEYDRMVSLGAFEGMRCELIDGDLIDKMGQNPPHAAAIRRLNAILANLFGADRVQMQLPIEAADPDRKRSLPEPDLSVLRELKPEFERRHPVGNELLLIVEVADSTLAGDLTRKAELYAHAGVPEYFVLDLNRRLLIAHRQPDGTQYRDVHIYSGTDTIEIRIPDRAEPATVEVRSLLPEAA